MNKADCAGKRSSWGLSVYMRDTSRRICDVMEVVLFYLRYVPLICTLWKTRSVVGSELVQKSGLPMKVALRAD